MDKIFGSSDLKLQGKDGAVTPVSALAEKQVVGLYFSAHWCPPCRGFTPKLAEAYKTISADKSFEIVFISSDRDEAAFASYHAEMPFLALPFAERDVKKALSKRFKVSGIPSLILLDGATGAVLSKDGRRIIDSDPAGENFPWKPKTLEDIMGDTVLRREGDDVKSVKREEALGGKTLALYFSAHWCPPCKRFTPELAKTYAALKAAGRDDVEFVFVSGDRDEEAFKKYFATMPWLALPFDEERYEELSSHFEVDGIPTLITLSPEGKVITTKARAAAGADPEGKDFPWAPKPVASLETAAEELNETPTVIVLCEEASAEDKKAAAEALAGPAKEALEAAAAADMDPVLMFATGEEKSSVAEQVRKLCKLDENAAAAGKAQMVLLDIPDEGGFYVWDNADGAALNEEAVRAFTAAYSAKTLKRQQLG